MLNSYIQKSFSVLCSHLNSLSTGEYEQILCSFYCHLEFWSLQTLERDIPLPPITPRERHLSLEEQWRRAIKERDRLAEFWRKESIRRGVIIDFPYSTDNSVLQNSTYVMSGPREILIYMYMLHIHTPNFTLY